MKRRNGKARDLSQVVEPLPNKLKACNQIPVPEKKGVEHRKKGLVQILKDLKCYKMD
jgi:hypothetical protein